jgi:hypothetical protein
MVHRVALGHVQVASVPLASHSRRFGDKLSISSRLRRSNSVAFSIIDNTFHLVGVTFVYRATQNEQPGTAKETASNEGEYLGFFANVLVGSPASNNDVK